ncbi:hypothetical protein [Tessaracoccus sp. Y1736]
MSSPDGAQQWYRGGRLHREDGPALTFHDGAQLFYRGGGCTARTGLL